MQFCWEIVLDIQWYLNAFNTYVLRLVVFCFLSIFLLGHAIKLPAKFWMITWPFSLPVHERIRVDVYWVCIQLVQCLFIFLVKINALHRRFKWWAKSRPRYRSLHHLFSLPFSIFSLIEFLASLQTDAFISTSSSTYFIIFLLTIPDCILKNLTATCSLLSIALTKYSKVLHENSTTL